MTDLRAQAIRDWRESTMRDNFTASDAVRRSDSLASTEKPSPRNTKPATKGGVGVPTSGKYRTSGDDDIAHNSSRLQAAICGDGEALSKATRPSRGSPRNPNEESRL
jgi:hypothetical protein